MSEEALFNLLRSTGLSVAYDHFDDDPGNKTVPPFILYRNTDTFTKSADDHTFYKENNYIVDLVTENKDTALEAGLEALFDENYLPYDKEENYLNDERIYQIRYFV